MNGHVIAHREHFTVGIVNRAGIIAALFYVWGECRAAQGGSHFFGYGMEDIFEYFETGWVDFRRRPSA
jgi:methyl coenzyme M reductase beta subunit